MKLKKYTNTASKYLFSLMTAVYLAAGAGILKSTIETSRRENISYIHNQHSSIFQFPLEREDVVIPFSEFIHLYTDCDQKIYNHRTFEYAKTKEEIIKGVRRRKNLEGLWTRYFNEQVNIAPFRMRYIDTTPEWQDPLDWDSWFKNSFNDPRPRKGRWKEKHEAIDIFSRVGSDIHSPISGVVVASADDWKGSWNRRTELQYESGGLGELAGNGIILFNPADTSYYLMIHMRDVYARGGDVISRGEIVGTVGKTGNALSPYVRPHLHFAYKKPGTGCGIERVLVAQNPYWNLREIRRELVAQRNGKSLGHENP